MKLFSLFLSVMILFSTLANGKETAENQILGLWEFSKGYEIFSSFELSKHGGERSFYEWSAQLPLGEAQWELSPDNILKIRWPQGREEIFVIKILDDKQLLVTNIHSKAETFFIKK